MAWSELPFLESGAISDANNSRWTVAIGTFGQFHQGAGRSGLAINGAWSATGGVTLGQVLVGAYTSLWCGAAFFNLYAGGQADLIRLNLDNTPDAGCPQARLFINGDGSMQVTLSINGGASVTSAKFSLSNRPLVNGVWYFIEIGVVVSGGNTITCDVFVNDVHLLVAFSNNFGAFTNSNWNRVWFTASSAGAGSSLGDLYINKSGFYGDGYVLVLRPDSAGNYTQWTSSTANPNWQNVDEYPPSAAAYNSSANIGDKDTYGLTDLPAGYTTIKAVQADVWAEKDNTGAAGFKALWRSGGVDSLGTQEFFPQSGAYEYFREGNELSPFSGAAWTFAELNAIEFGQQRTT
jgi:hypothetical protein